ncbi:MAG: alpha/beta hydrolase [Planctomycetes bacterium]|nr:alpha/beta hydrolase [Planctomycetota bacterium]
MTVDPQVQQFLAEIAAAAVPAMHEQTPAEARQQMEAASAALAKPPVDSIEDQLVAGADGEIPIRIYKPDGDSLPVVVYFHGGGWVIGSIETHDGYCRSLANAASAIVVSVDYRLAPEHRFPAAAEDAYEATRWASDNIVATGGQTGQLSVAGDSSGGNLAAVVALMARDRSGPPITSQALIYPITDHDFDTASYVSFADGHYLTRETMIWFWDLYCGDDADRDHAYLSPLHADDLRGLPPALVLTAECDPLCDEGEAYAEQLRAADVEVTLSRYDGMIHGFTRRLNLFDKAQDALEEVAAFVKAKQ